MTCNPETVSQRRGHIYEAHTDTAASVNTKTIEIDGVDDFHLLDGTRLLIRFTNGNTSSTMRLVVDGVTADLINANDLTTWGEDSISDNTTVLVTYNRTTSLFKATTLFSSTVSISIDGTNVLDGAIGSTKLANNSIITSKIADNSITHIKMGASSVWGDVIQDGSISEVKLGAESVTTDKVKDRNITGAKIALNTIIQENIGGDLQLCAENFTTELKNKLTACTSYSSEQIDTAIGVVQAELDTLVGGNASTAIDSFHEIEAFLATLTDSQTLTGILNDLRTTLETDYNTKITTLDSSAVHKTGDETIGGVKTFSRGGIFQKGAVLQGQDTLPTGIGDYVAVYNSPTYGLRILGHDGSGYKPLKIGALVNGKFAIETNADGTTAFYGNVSAPNIAFNATVQAPLAAGLYHSLASAIGAVPAELRGLNKEISFLSAAYEVDTLTVTAGATADGNVTVTLNGVAFTVAVLTTDNTAALVAAKLRAATYTGWVVSGTDASVIFTSTAVGVKSVPVFTANSTGVTGAIVVSTAGAAETWVSYKYNANSLTGWASASNWKNTTAENISITPTPAINSVIKELYIADENQNWYISQIRKKAITGNAYSIILTNKNTGATLTWTSNTPNSECIYLKHSTNSNIYAYAIIAWGDIEDGVYSYAFENGHLNAECMYLHNFPQIAMSIPEHLDDLYLETSSHTITPVNGSNIITLASPLKIGQKYRVNIQAASDCGQSIFNVFKNTTNLSDKIAYVGSSNIADGIVIYKNSEEEISSLIMYFVGITNSSECTVRVSRLVDKNVIENISSVTLDSYTSEINALRDDVLDYTIIRKLVDITPPAVNVGFQLKTDGSLIAYSAPWAVTDYIPINSIGLWVNTYKRLSASYASVCWYIYDSNTELYTCIDSYTSTQSTPIHSVLAQLEGHITGVKKDVNGNYATHVRFSVNTSTILGWAESYVKSPANTQNYIDGESYSGIEYFDVEVETGEIGTSNLAALDFENNIGADHCAVRIPKNYSPDKQYPLIIYCHGAGSPVTATSCNISSTIVDNMWKFFSDMGFFILDFNGLPSNMQRSWMYSTYSAGMGSPCAIRAAVEAYKYVTKKYSIAADAVFVIGTSMGGLTANNIVSNTNIPVAAVALDAAVVDLYLDCWNSPWWNSVQNAGAVAFLYNFDYFRELDGVPQFSLDEGANYINFSSATQAQLNIYYYTNLSKVTGYNPPYNRRFLLSTAASGISVPQQPTLENSGVVVGTTTFDYISSGLSYPCPLRLWTRESDGLNQSFLMLNFVKMLQNSGVYAESRIISNVNTHGVINTTTNTAGDFIWIKVDSNGVVISDPDGTATYAYHLSPFGYEMYQFIKMHCVS